MKKENERLVAQPKGEGKKPLTNPVAPSHAWEMRHHLVGVNKKVMLHLAHAWEMRLTNAPSITVTDAGLLHLAHAWEMRLLL